MANRQHGQQKAFDLLAFARPPALTHPHGPNNQLTCVSRLTLHSSFMFVPWASSTVDFEWPSARSKRINRAEQNDSLDLQQLLTFPLCGAKRVRANSHNARKLWAT